MLHALLPVLNCLELKANFLLRPCNFPFLWKYVDNVHKLTCPDKILTDSPQMLPTINSLANVTSPVV